MRGRGTPTARFPYRKQQRLFRAPTRPSSEEKSLFLPAPLQRYEPVPALKGRATAQIFSPIRFGWSQRKTSNPRVPGQIFPGFVSKTVSIQASSASGVESVWDSGAYWWTVDMGSCQMWLKLPPEICFHRFCLETQCGVWEQLGDSE